ncbi:hypothetical protein [Tsukamurella hominis]|uniref:hypothetical protein n=1 Tax=Tsukamurella hominis TaxID=1970232 RepID=UPI0039E936EC
MPDIREAVRVALVEALHDRAIVPGYDRQRGYVIDEETAQELAEYAADYVLEAIADVPQLTHQDIVEIVRASRERPRYVRTHAQAGRFRS